MEAGSEESDNTWHGGWGVQTVEASHCNLKHTLPIALPPLHVLRGVLFNLQCPQEPLGHPRFESLSVWWIDSFWFWKAQMVHQVDADQLCVSVTHDVFLQGRRQKAYFQKVLVGSKSRAGFFLVCSGCLPLTKPFPSISDSFSVRLRSLLCFWLMGISLSCLLSFLFLWRKALIGFEHSDYASICWMTSVQHWTYLKTRLS